MDDEGAIPTAEDILAMAAMIVALKAPSGDEALEYFGTQMSPGRMAIRVFGAYVEQFKGARVR